MTNDRKNVEGKETWKVATSFRKFQLSHTHAALSLCIEIDWMDKLSNWSVCIQSKHQLYAFILFQFFPCFIHFLFGRCELYQAWAIPYFVGKRQRSIFLFCLSISPPLPFSLSLSLSIACRSPRNGVLNSMLSLSIYDHWTSLWRYWHMHAHYTSSQFSAIFVRRHRNEKTSKTTATTTTMVAVKNFKRGTMWWCFEFSDFQVANDWIFYKSSK